MTEAQLARETAFLMIEAAIRMKCAALIQHANVFYDGQWRYDYEGACQAALDDLARRKEAAK